MKTKILFHLYLIKNNAAYSVLEVCASLAISLPALLAISTLIKQSSSNLSRSLKIKNETYNASRITGLLRQMSAQIDSHPFYIFPRVHKSGNIRLTNGDSNIIANKPGSVRPDKLSDAITYLNIAVTETLDIVNINQTNISACARYGAKISKSKYENYLLLGPSGFFEGTAGIINTYTAADTNCADMVITPCESMIANSLAKFNSELIRVLIPVEKIYTLYTDRKKTFRFLGHICGKNTESQPVLSGVLPLAFRIKLTPLSLLNIQADIQTELLSNPLKISVVNKLKRNYFYNFLLNLP